MEPAKRIPAVIVATDAEANAAYSTELNLIATLARLDAEQTSVASAPPTEVASAPENFVQIIVNESLEVYLPLAGLADPVKEIARLTKQETKMQKEIDGLAGRVNSPAFVDKAPAAVVEKAQKELSELQEQLAVVRSRIEQMQALVAK